MIWDRHWKQLQNFSSCLIHLGFLKICCLLLLLHHVSPAISSSTPKYLSEEHSMCIQRDNWKRNGRKDDTQLGIRIHRSLSQFKSEHYSRLKVLGQPHECNLCYTLSFIKDLDSTGREILEQGCLLSESECDANSCSNLNDENTSLRNDAFQETLVSDDMTHPDLERNVSNILVPDILTGDKTVRELEGLGHLRLDTCCFADPRSNCDDRTFYQPDHLSKPNCITNQDISNLEQTNQKIFSNPSIRSSQDHVLHYILILLAFLIIMVVSILFLVRYFKLNKFSFVDRKHDLEMPTEVDLEITKESTPRCKVSFTPETNATPSSNATIDLKELRLGSLMEQRRSEYSIFQGSLGSKPVLIKSFPKKQNYFNEREVYELVNRRRQRESVRNFLEYFGSGETLTSNDGSSMTNFIVLEFSNDCYLSDVLERTSVSWQELCKMLSTISQGLSYLHGFNRATEPNLCHRNINGRNILVKRDMSCCLCNFDHVVVTNSSGQQPFQAFNASENNRSLVTNENENTEDVTVSEIVGHPRYLAPEVLDHALGSQRGEFSLKQVDVYAMGLVFWEISRRCRDLYQGVSVPTYEMAFYQELGPQRANPTLEQMQILVSRYKARPLFPEIWKNSNPAIQRLRETIEDSWDQDGEARLTAICIVERIHELNLLWERYKKVNTLQSRVGNTNRMNIMPNNQNTQMLASDEGISINNPETVPPTAIRPSNFHNNRLSFDNQKKGSLDFDKTIGGKPVVDVHRSKNNNLYSRQQTMAQIQPHQGRNPCLERNIASASNRSQIGDESCPLLLIYGSVKDTPLQTGPRTDAYHQIDLDEDMMIEDSELDMFTMENRRQVPPQPISLNFQNNFGRNHEDASMSSFNENKPNKSGRYKLNSFWKKKAGLKESVDTNVPRRKPDINQEWEKEYQIASQQDHQEEIADVEAEEE